jgi:hypothetical protein
MQTITVLSESGDQPGTSKTNPAKLLYCFKANAIGFRLKWVLVLSILLSTYTIGFAQVIFSNPITGTNPSSTNPYIIGQIVSADVTASGISRGTGINGVNTNNAYNASGWEISATTLNAADYFEWTITPKPGFRLDFISFAYNAARGAFGGPQIFSLRSSADNFATAIAAPAAAGGTISLVGAAFQNRQAAITFRLYGYSNSSAILGTYSINDFIFSGTTCAIPNITGQPPSQTICSGTPLNLSVTATGVASYIWKKDGVVIPDETNSSYSIPSALSTDSGSYTVELTGGCGVTVSNPAVVAVNENLTSSVSIGSNLGTTICAGTNITFTATPENGGVASYQWTVNNAPVGTNSATYSTTSLTNNAVVKCTMNSSTLCLSGLPAVSNEITMTVNPLQPVTVSVVATASTICAGTEVTFTATPSNGGSTPSYQWKIGAANAGTNSPVFTTSSLANGNIVTCIVTSNISPCPTGNPATSNAITLTVNPNPTALTITPANPTVCEGDVTLLTANGGVVSGIQVLNQNFNAATNNWTTENTSTGTVANSAWTLRADNYTYLSVFIFHSNDNTQFYLSNSLSNLGGTTNTRLVSPVFSLEDLTTATLTFYDYYSVTGGSDTDVAKVQISVNGGTWTDLVSYTTTARGAIAAFQQETIDLTPYVNQTNLKIRFNYVASGNSWAIDNVAINATGSRVTWLPTTNLYTNAAGTTPYGGGIAKRVYAKLTSDATYTAKSTSFPGCTASNTVSLIVNPKPLLGGVSQLATVCENTSATINLAGLLSGSTSTISYSIDNVAATPIAGVLADAFGNAQFAAPVVLANDSKILKITNIQRTDLAVSCSYSPIVNNTVVLDVNKNEIYYADNDDDGFGDVGPTIISCFGVPEGYSANNTDCDDGNAAAHERFVFYIDNDDDGYGVGISISLCNPNATVAPGGYAVLVGDCDDDDAASHQTFQFYIDADEDTYGDKNGSLLDICAPAANLPPTGYSVNNGDCRDDLPAVHPNVIEVGYNLIDDDCDGSVDEGYPPKITSLMSTYCNVTLPVINSYIYAYLVAGAQGYRWRVTKMVSGLPVGTPQEIDTQLRGLKLTQLAEYAFDTDYKVEVAVYYAGFLQAFTPSNCVVHTPATTTQLSTCATGFQMNAITDIVYANIVPFATGYRFKVYASDNLGVFQEIERSLREFRMNLITDFTVRYGKTYLVETAIRNTDGVSYLPYGSPCSVTTPLFPTTSIQSPQCDNGLGAPYPVANNSTQIYASSFPGAIAYVFKLTGPGLPLAGATAIKLLRVFNLSDFSGAVLIPGATYNVSVRLVFNWTDPEGPYGKVCTLSTPGQSRAIAPGSIHFDAMAHPNPFSEAFNIYVDTGSKAAVNIKVYDMTGRLLETRMTTPDEVPLLDIGSRYPAGVYTVIINQEQETRTLRIIKR